MATHVLADEPPPRSSEPDRYVTALVEAWTGHNVMCDQLDDLLGEAKVSGREDMAFGRRLFEAYLDMHKIDLAKRRLSAAIKRVIADLLDTAAPEHRLGLLTTVRASFWTRYVRDHVEILAGRGDQHLVCRTYHRGSSILLAYRLEHDPMLAQLVLQVARPGLVQHGPHDQFRYGDELHELVQLLLWVDNYCEPLWIKTLVGIPDYFVRRLLAEHIKRHSKTTVSPFDHWQICQSFGFEHAQK